MNSKGFAARVLIVLVTLLVIVAAAIAGYRQPRPEPTEATAGQAIPAGPVAPTADLIAEIAAVYEGARSKVTAFPLPVPEPMSMPFRPHLSLLLQNGVRLSLVWHVEDETGVAWRGPDHASANWVVKDRALAAWIQAAPSRFKSPSGGDWLLPSRRLHVGDELTIHLEALPEAEPTPRRKPARNSGRRATTSRSGEPVA